jgi:hypothetical protein
MMNGQETLRIYEDTELENIQVQSWNKVEWRHIIGNTAFYPSEIKDNVVCMDSNYFLRRS